MNTPENEVKRAILEYLLYNRWLVLRINSGGVTGEHNGKKRFVRFCYWQHLGTDESSAGISDILAIKEGFPALCVECKAPGKLAAVSVAQDRFLAAWRQSGGVSLVCESVEDLVYGLRATEGNKEFPC